MHKSEFGPVDREQIGQVVSSWWEGRWGGAGGGLDDSGIGIEGGLEIWDSKLLDVRFRVVCKGRILSWGPFGFFVV